MNLQNQNFASYLTTWVFVAFLFSGTVAFAAFIEPTQTAPEGNAWAPLHSGNAPQVKEGNFGAHRIITNGKLCFGPSSCIGGWWDTAQNTCQLQVKKVNSFSRFITDGGATDQTCNFFLTAGSKAAGWVAVGSDRCGTMSDRDCQRPTTCIYMRMVCSSVVVEQPTTSPLLGIENHPVPGFTQ